MNPNNDASAVHHLIEAQARRTPDLDAVIAGTERWSYRRLDARAAWFARRLADAGVRRGTLVGVHMRRSVDLLAAILGVMKAGGAYVPLDPSYPAARRRDIVQDAGLTVVVADDGEVPGVGGEGPGLAIVRAPSGDEGDDAAPPRVEVGGDDVAYVMYTSGSTGRPKGVVVTHRNVVNFLVWARAYLGDASLHRVLLATSLSFDISAIELLLPWTCGGASVLASNALELGELPARDELTLVNTVPSVMSELLGLGALPENVHTVCLGGEALPRSLAERLLARPHVRRLVNLYGPTETTIYSTVAEVRAGGTRPPPIGRPVANTRVYVLDEHLAPVPAEAPGELYVGGDGVARGYLGQPQLTSERFLDDPFLPGERIYRTGDLARFTSDGELEFLGRADTQVKIRGYRIELGEIELALDQHPAIAQSVVVAHEDATGDRRLVAYVVTGAAPPTVAELRRFIADRLPAQMIPSLFVRLAALPRTANGKLDRKALPGPTPDSLLLEGGDGAPRTPTETWMATLWAEILRVPGVGVHDDFFELGGHSLLAMRLLSRLRDQAGVPLTLRDLFGVPTVAGLAALIEERRSQLEQDALQPLAAQRWSGRCRPVSPSQEGLWFLEQLNPGSPVYNLFLSIPLRGPLDVEAVGRALAVVVRRHEPLRTRFFAVQGRPVAIVSPPVDTIDVPVTDLRRVPPKRRGEELARRVDEEGGRAFDLTRDLLLRPMLVLLDRDEALLGISTHHIVADGWSLDVLRRELVQLLAAPPGQLPELPELPVAFSDFARQQRERLADRALDAQIEFWRRELAGAPPGLQLHTDFPRTGAGHRPAGSVFAYGSEAATAAVAALARSESATPYMVYLTAFLALLHRHTGQPTVCVGSPIANRDEPAAEDLIGLFVNSLAIRGDLDGDPSFGELLRRVRERVLNAFANKDLPFEKLVAELKPAREPGRTPIFQVMFTLQDMGAGAPAGERPDPDAAWRRLTLPLPDREEPLDLYRSHGGGVAKFDLVLFVTPTSKGARFALEYDAGLFDPDTIARLLASYVTLLHHAVAAPAAPMRRLRPVSLEEARALRDFGRSETRYPDDATIDGLFERRAEAHPDRIALVFEGRPWTYGELDRGARAWAAHLRALGVQDGEVVALCVPRSATLVLAMLAILKARAAYLPLDVADPPERWRRMLEDGQVRFVLAVPLTASELPAGPWQLVDVSGEPPAAEPPAAEPPAAEPGGAGAAPRTSDEIAYVMFTSGSTGRPKGVEVTHRGVVRLVTHQAYARLGPDEVFLQYAPVTFDASTFEIWAPLLNGSVLMIAPPQVLSLVDLGRVIRELRVTTLFLTTPLFHQMVEERLDDLRGVRQILTGGDVLSVGHARGALERLPGCVLVNAYGPTECTTFATCHRVAEVSPAETNIPIGRPLAGTDLEILDVDGAPVPIGVAGEIVVGGDAVARGYRGLPELEAGRFVDDPRRPGRRRYRTGDLGRWLRDGSIQFLGRTDDQAKIRGFRVEPGEVETVLADHPAVKQAFAAAVPDGEGGKKLLAWYIARDGDLPRAKLREYLRERLPHFMVPAVVIPLTAFPLTQTGKIDRSALPRSAALAEEAPDPAAPPLTTTQKRIAALFAQLLDVPAVGLHDDFFELGGHSLLATRLIARLRQMFSIDVPLQALLEAPTVAALAALVDKLIASGQRVDLPPLTRRTSGDRAPLSFAQARLWFIEQLRPGQATYNITDVHWLARPADADLVRRGLDELIRRHEILRTSFHADRGEPYQRIHRDLAAELQVVDPARVARDPDALRAVQRLRDEASQRPFDLERPPLLRATLIQLPDHRACLVVCMHHIIADAWSLAILRQELDEILRALAAGEPSALPELPLQYADYAVWQRTWLTEERLAPLVDYWRRQLGLLPPPLALPEDGAAQDPPTFASHSVGIELPRALAERLAALGRGADVSLFTTMVAALAALLSRYTGDTDLVIGTTIANRTPVETEALIGFFVNTLPLRVDCAGAPTFSELLGRVREIVLGALAHQDLPFERLVEELHPERGTSETAFFRIMFAYVSSPRAEGPPIEAPRVVRGAPGTAKFDLSLAVTESPAGLTASLEYRAELFDGGLMERLVRHYGRLLAAVVDHADVPITGLPLLDDEERAWLAARAADRGLCVVDGHGALVPPGVIGELWLAEDGAPAEPLARRARWRSDGTLQQVDEPGEEAPAAEEEEASSPRADHVAPRTRAEEAIAGFFGEVLGRSDLGIHDSFFELGGHSLLATRLMSRLRGAFGVELSLRQLFKSPTVAGLAEALRSAPPAAAERPRKEPIRPLARGAELQPLSFAQERFWLLSRMDQASPELNLPCVYTLPAPLDELALARSLAGIVDRHDVLRTRFVEVDGRAYQLVDPPAELAIKLIDLRGLAPADRRRRRDELVAAEAARPFDLEYDAPWRATLVRAEEHEYLLLVTVHHAAADAWSFEVFQRELQAFYEALRTRSEPSLPPLPIQYTDFAFWQRQQATGELFRSQLEYWRGALDGIPDALPLPYDRPPSATAGRASRCLLLELSSDVQRELAALCKRADITTHMALLAAWSLVLHRRTGSDDVVLGVPIVNRDRQEIEPLIGVFLNTLVLRTRFAGVRDLRALFEQVREASLGAFAHQDLPFERLVEELRPERRLGRAPLFNVMFAHQAIALDPGAGDAAREAEASGAPAWTIEDGAPGWAKFDLWLSAIERPSRLRVSLEYASELFDRDTAVSLVEDFAQTIATMIRADSLYSPGKNFSEG